VKKRYFITKCSKTLNFFTFPLNKRLTPPHQRGWELMGEEIKEGVGKFLT
jgi:hypothetical protein